MGNNNDNDSNDCIPATCDIVVTGSFEDLSLLQATCT